jgi:hypothetical protein
MNRFHHAVAGLLLVVSGGLVSAVPAQATAFCEVLPTADGFAALRAAPSAGGRLIVKMPTGHMVQLDSTRDDAKGWRAVIYRGADGRQPMKAGWVASRLIESECG